MSQYTIIDENVDDTVTITGDTGTFRVQARNNTLCFDKALTDSGFDGIEGSDWDNESSYTYTANGRFRIGARDGYWVIDQIMTATGFDGVENTDWTNIEQHQLS